MVDASMILVPNTPAGAARVREWLLYCCQAPLITDAPNVCGLPDRPGFIEHRRDQSILSLLAARDGIELFRHPSQYGNHLKLAACRVDGEPTCFPYGAKGIYDNSPYGTLVNHHRGRLKGLRVDITRVLHAPRERVFEAWNRPDAFVNASALGCHVLIPHGDVRVGREFQVLTKKISGEMSPPMTGAYLKVEPPACLAYRWPWDTTVTVNFQDDGGKTIVTLTHEPFPNERMWYFQNVMWQRLLDGLAVHLDRVVEAEGDPLVEA